MAKRDLANKIMMLTGEKNIWKKTNLMEAQPRVILNNQLKKKTVEKLKVKTLFGQITVVQMECH